MKTESLSQAADSARPVEASKIDQKAIRVESVNRVVDRCKSSAKTLSIRCIKHHRSLIETRCRLKREIAKIKST